MPEVGRFLAGLDEEQIRTLARLVNRWPEILARQGYGKELGQLEGRKNLSATDKLLIVSAALARSTASLEKLAGPVPSTAPGATGTANILIAPAPGTPAGILNMVR